MNDSIISGEEGQDLVEYTLMLVFISLAGAAFYFGVGDSVSAIWSIVNARLNSAVE